LVVQVMATNVSHFRGRLDNRGTGHRGVPHIVRRTMGVDAQIGA
jgi:hypothetical protein